MTFILIKTIHLFAAFIYGGFLFTDNFFCTRIQRIYGEEKYKEIRESFMKYVRKVVPPSLIVLVVTGLYLFPQVFGTVGENGLTWFQKVMLLKAILGLWLGLRGFLQVYFGIQPFVFKSHRLPLILVVTILILTQIRYLPL
jgi:hypothetical protein